MNKVENVYFLVGPSCVGKTTISRSLKKQTNEFVVFEIDKIFFSKYGDIIEFANNNEWEEYLLKINVIIKEILQNFSEGERYLVTLPPSTLINSFNNEIAQKNKELLLEKYYLICLLTHKDHHLGADVSVSRHIERNYKISIEEKKKRYIQEAEFYSSVADYVVYTNENLKDNLEQIKKIIFQNA